MTTMFAWAVPAVSSGSPVDHTWVTTYDNRTNPLGNIQAVVAAREDYRFCWGSFHPAGGIPGNASGMLGSQARDLTLARCLVPPNASSNTVPAARGTTFVYGVDGVCHQLANQVLYATTRGRGLPLTAKQARGYVASVFVYGPYGIQHTAWANRVRGCSGSGEVAGREGEAPAVRASSDIATMVMLPELPDDFAAQAREVIGDDPELLARLLALRGEVMSFAAHKLPGFSPPGAATLNARNQHLIDQAAALLGRERFERLFGFPAGETIDLVDPTVISR